jgi:hypothetical protein
MAFALLLLEDVGNARPAGCLLLMFDLNPVIDDKVDVWSAGVILYQMLWGKRPFGEGMTQEQIMRDRVMLNAREVNRSRASLTHKS